MKEKVKGYYLIMFVVLLGCLILAGCSKEASSSKDSGTKKDVLVVGIEADPGNLDPFRPVGVHSQQVTSQIYEPILALDKNNRIVPLLADYKQLDDITYEFYVKKGVKFHNGDELKANDIIFSIKTGLNTPMVRFLWDSINPDTIVQVDDYTVRFQLFSPSGSFLSNLTSFMSLIVNEKAYIAGGEDYQLNPVGTGPMKFVSWEKNVSCVVERFDGYHGTLPEIKTIIFKPIVEFTSRAIELESGGVDVVLGVPPTDIKRIEENPDFRIEVSPGYSIRYVGFNCSKPPFDNKLVRQALSHAVDAEGITRSIRTDKDVVISAPYSPVMMFYDKSIEHISYDPALAKQLLVQAGYPNGFSTTIIADERKERVDIATIIQQQFKEIGVNAEIKVLEWGSFLNATYGGDTEVYVMGWAADTADPDNIVGMALHSSLMGQGGNMSFVNDPKLDDLIERGRMSSDYDERAKIYSELQQVMKDLSPWIYLWAETFYDGVSNKIDYIELNPGGINPYYKIRFK